MLDRERLLAKLDELAGYLRDLRQIAPSTFEDYQKVQTKRACERLLQISIEAVIDVCGLIVAGLRLGLPSDEEDTFEKLRDAGLISPPMLELVKRMKAFRNILVHAYGRIDDRLVYEMVADRLSDFERFSQEILSSLRDRGLLN